MQGCLYRSSGTHGSYSCSPMTTPAHPRPAAAGRCFRSQPAAGCTSAATTRGGFLNLSSTSDPTSTSALLPCVPGPTHDGYEQLAVPRAQQTNHFLFLYLALPCGCCCRDRPPRSSLIHANLNFRHPAWVGGARCVCFPCVPVRCVRCPGAPYWALDHTDQIRPFQGSSSRGKLQGLQGRAGHATKEKKKSLGVVGVVIDGHRRCGRMEREILGQTCKIQGSAAGGGRGEFVSLGP